MKSPDGSKQNNLVAPGQDKTLFHSCVYADRNKSKIYSAKLYTKFNKEIKLLTRHPNLGIKTEIESVRGLIVGEFIIYYEHQYNTIIIHTIWDSRQDPDKLTIR